MYEISQDLYLTVARMLCDAIGGDNYFSGSIGGTCADTEWRLTASLVIYRDKERAPDGDILAIKDIVPVWYEFHTFGSGTETLNDFDFRDLLQHVV